jgi:hypothetical protein
MNLFTRFSVIPGSLCFLFLSFAGAQEPSVQTDSNSLDSAAYEKPLYRKITFHGSASMENGQIVKGQYGLRGQGVKEYEHLWVSTNYLKLRSFMEVNDRLQIKGGITGKLWFDNFPASERFDPAEVYQPNYDFYFDRAEGLIRVFGSWDKPLLLLSSGTFPFKYDPDVRNLGEYLFRGAISPGYLITDFDYAYARLSGIKAFSTFNFGICRIEQNLLLTTEAQVYPFNDYSLSYLLGAEVGKFLNCGAGISLWHFLSVNEDATTPKISTNIMYIDSSNNSSKDTVYYSSRGIKVMGRVSLDPKVFLPFAGFFGKEDLKIYGEALAIGLKNYKEVYKHIGDRMPLTFGFNWPTHPLLSYTLIPIAAMLGFDKNDFDKHRIVLGSGAILGGVVAGTGTWFLEKYLKTNLHLDVLSVEAEWYGNPYWDADKTLSQYGPLPKPDDPAGSYTSTINGFTYDNWKWSIYAKKTILGGLSLVGQAARDHMRMSEKYPKYYDFEAALEQNSHWWWVLKMQYDF